MGEAVHDLRSAFKKDHGELCLYRAKIALLVGIAVVPFFAGLDYTLAREHFRIFLITRITTTLVAVVMLALIVASRKIGLKLSSFFVSFYGVTLGAMLSYMCFKLGGFNSTYYVGIIIVILGASLTMPWHPGYHLFMTLGMYASYLFQLFFVGMNAPLGTFINNNYFLFAAVGMTYVGSILQYRMHFLLKQKDEYKNQFFANVSHELKTPMTLVVTPLESARLKLPKAAPEVVLPRETFESVRHNAYRLAGLISDLLDLTKSEIGKARVSPIDIQDTGEFFQRIFTSVKPLMAEKGLQGEFVGGEGVAPHFFDTAKIDKVIVNLLSNAIKFTPKGGKIVVRAWDEEVPGEREPVLKIRVEDTGIGIPDDKLSHVFDRFMQVDQSSTRAYTGMGIGLSLVKDFVEQHGGTVDVESTLGQGTSFTVSLPRGREHFKAQIAESPLSTSGRGVWGEGEESDIGRGIELPKVSLVDAMGETKWEEEEESPLPSAGEGGRRPGEGDTVLIVDDTPDMRHAVREVLRNKYRVIAARDGEEGVRIARERKPDLILSDVMMPKKDGYGLLQDLKGNPETREIPIILLTAKSGEENLALGFQFGADDYISKPFQPKEVVARVGNLIRMRRQKEEIERQRDELGKLNSELKETEAELVQSEKLSTVGLLAAGVAHEINNPAYSLTLNLANLESILGEVKGNGISTEFLNQFDHHVKRSQQEIERIKKIVRTLLGYSQKNREGVTMRPLVEDIEGTLVLLKRTIDDAGIAIHWNPAGKTDSIEADHAALNQVFTNLLQNSLQAGAKNITIEVDSDESTCRVRVADDGCGITPEIMPHIFEPFFTTKDVGEGAGLGLNIVHRIVRAHHGEVMVASRVGKGTEFRIVLPLQQPHDDVVEKRPGERVTSLHIPKN